MMALKSFDFTCNPSWSDSTVEKIIDDDGTVLADINQKMFSETIDDNSNIKVKVFSSLDGIGEDMPRTSKVENKFTVLKAKEFSADGTVTEFREEEMVVEQKEFTAATIKERLRYAKLNPRMRARRLFLEYKQVVKQMGGVEKMDEETLKTLKSLFVTDVLDIFKSITPEILNGKQINTLLGASSLGKNLRVAAQNLQMPARMAFMEMSKKGYLSPQRMKKLQESYMEFIKAMQDEVFSSNPIPAGLEEEINAEEGEK